MARIWQAAPQAAEYALDEPVIILALPIEMDSFDGLTHVIQADTRRGARHELVRVPSHHALGVEFTRHVECVCFGTLRESIFAKSARKRTV